VATEDKAIPPAAERFEAEEAVVDVIARAAGA
jgi:hypothetical protein